MAFKRQRNYCNRLYKREKKQFYTNLDIKDVTDNKKFWKTVKPLLGDKGGLKEKILVVEKEQMITKDEELA